MTSDEHHSLIRNRFRAKQLIDFGGLQFEQITPTDIDGLIEFRNIAYIIYEFKYADAEMPFGQRLAIERMVDAFQCAGKKAVAFLCKHYVQNPDEDVIAKDAIVEAVYMNHTWYRADGEKNTANELTTRFLNYVKGGTK